MRDELKWMIYCLALGITLTAYAHQQFATRDDVRDMKDILTILDQRVYEIHTEMIPKKRK